MVALRRAIPRPGMAACRSVTAGYPGGSGTIYDSIIAFRERNMMSNKPHLRPHKKKRQPSRTARLLVAVLFLAIFALAVALAVTGRYVPHGRFILLRGPLAVDGGSGGISGTNKAQVRKIS